MLLEEKSTAKQPLGVAAHTAAFVHDVFNIICISGLTVWTLLNWRLDWSVWTTVRLSDGPSAWATRWRGQSQDLLLAALFLYFAVDTVFVRVLPQCVKVPGAIIVHHLVVFAAMFIPWQYGDTHGYTIGIFMMADLNTVFLLLRKMLIRSKAPPPRGLLCTVSACFYLTWVVVRLILYPVWFVTVSWPEWLAAWERTGYPVNTFVVMPCTHGVAVILNFKWTWDLCSGMWRRRLRSSEAGGAGGESLTEPLLGRESAHVVKRRAVPGPE